jgi:hypothetical protein
MSTWNVVSYQDPHNPTRTIEVRAKTRAFGQMPGAPLPADEPEPAHTTETLPSKDLLMVTGSWKGLTDKGMAKQPLYFAISADMTWQRTFKSRTAALHWLWLLEGVRK